MSQRARARFSVSCVSEKGRNNIAGPFTEAKELVGGCAIEEVADRQQAMNLATRFMQLGLGLTLLAGVGGLSSAFMAALTHHDRHQLQRHVRWRTAAMMRGACYGCSVSLRPSIATNWAIRRALVSGLTAV